MQVPDLEQSHALSLAIFDYPPSFADRPQRRKRYASRAMPGWIGPWEIAILLVIVLLVFGPKRLHEMGRSLGKGMREFKNSITGKDEDDHPAELSAAAAELPVATAAEPKEPVSTGSERDS